MGQHTYNDAAYNFLKLKYEEYINIGRYIFN